MTDKKEKLILPPGGKRNVWLRIGTLIDGVSSKPLHNAHVVYNADAILFVGSEETSPPSRNINPGQTRPDLNLPHYTLLPGLIEAHAHLFLEGSELDLEKRKSYLQKPPREMLQSARSCFEVLVKFGIVAVRDAGDKYGVGLTLAKLYRGKYDISERDVILMPYIDSPGTAIHHKGGYGSFMAEPVEHCKSLHDCVKSRVDGGADRIKLIATDIIDFNAGKVIKQPQMTTEEISQLVTIAKNFGRQTFAHASGDDGIARAIEGGVDSIEHGFFIREDQLARMRDRQIAWVPTFTPVQKQIKYADNMGWNDKVISNLKTILDRHSSSLMQAHQMGVPIIAGSDAGSYGVAHGYGLLDELELMEYAGLSPLSVINTATGNSSSRLAFKEQFGQIKPGYKSRFILTRHSPLNGISNLRKERYVVFDGVIYGGTPYINSGEDRRP